MSGNERSHTRSPETFEVKVEDLKIDPDFQTDQGLVNAYKNLAKGKGRVALTRIATEQIHTGFYKRSSGGEITHISNLKPEHAYVMERQIRGGHRPVLDLFWNAHCANQGGFVCPDDENSLQAYRNANIAIVPCRIIKPKKIELPEAQIWLERGKQAVRISKSIPPHIKGYASFFGKAELALSEAAPKLLDVCSGVRKEIEEFHHEAGLGLHYHEMLFAFVRRHELAIETIADLLNKGRAEHSLAIMRVAYEGFLNFYLDWLAPEFFGPRFQLLAVLRQAESANRPLENDAFGPLENFPGLLENAAQKARLSPLGTLYHTSLYPPLSLVVHQSYANIEKHALGFEECTQDLSELDEKQLSRWLDLLTATIVVRVRNEVGEQFGI